MIRLLSVPMIGTGFVCGFFFFLYFFLSFRTKNNDKQNKSYLIFSVLSLINTIYVTSFAVFINSSSNLDTLSMANRITIITSMYVILLALHFNKYFFDLPGKLDLFIFYSLNIIFSIICLFDTRFFLTTKLFNTSKYYTGLEVGFFFNIWGAYVIIMMLYAIITIFNSYRLHIKIHRTYRSPLLFLLVAAVIWNLTGILDALTGLRIIDIPPLTWLGSLVMILCIEIILVIKIEDLHLRVSHLYEQVTHDSSTKVFSKNYFEMEMDRKISDTSHVGVSHYLVLIDIDDFKNINDTYGHVIGDIVLKRLAEIMKQNLRQPDIIARFGGDEFIILMSHSAGIELTIKIMERIRTKIQDEKFDIPDNDFNVTCSFGITTFDEGSLHAIKSREEIISKADSALYHAKHQGKNKVYILDTKEN